MVNSEATASNAQVRNGQASSINTPFGGGKIHRWENINSNLDKYVCQFGQIHFAVWMGNAQVRNGGVSRNTPLGGG